MDRTLGKEAGEVTRGGRRGGRPSIMWITVVSCSGGTDSAPSVNMLGRTTGQGLQVRGIIFLYISKYFDIYFL